MDQLDAVAAAPEHHKVLLENDQIRVLETLILPGEETAVHTHVWSGFCTSSLGAISCVTTGIAT